MGSAQSALRLWLGLSKEETLHQSRDRNGRANSATVFDLDSLKVIQGSSFRAGSPMPGKR